MKPVPSDPAKRLSELLGEDFVFGTETKRRAENWLLNETRVRKNIEKMKRKQ
jgi:hypothetical protein